MSKSTFLYPERPDFATIREDAAKEVATELGAIAHPMARARRAVEIMEQAETDRAEHQTRRDHAALSLWAYEGHRTRGLEQSMGCTRMQWTRIQAGAFGWKITGNTPPPPTPPAGPDRIAAARAAGIAELPVDKALDQVATFGMFTEQDRARNAEAMKFRDAAILALRQPPYQLSHEAIAAQIGMAATATSMTATKRVTDENRATDLETARQAAVRLVAAELDGLAPADRARRAAEIARAAAANVDEYTQLRHRAALSLWAYGGSRIRSMPRALGCTREEWDKVWTAALGHPADAAQDPEPPRAGAARARLAHEHGVTELPVEDALADLKKYELLIVTARARHDEAQRAHDQAAGQV
ncbi:hypothetical protein [Streptomyces sp. MJM8645]|uniref:hypothetical protein n=1 Tax=Streptomycetaceae TaxID=2062 RepID=UPI0007AF9F61|nr:hypothetical protein [Streptomyces sp. MJM8645]